MNKYKCCVCKGVFAQPSAMNNGAGHFCQRCKDATMAKVQESRKKNNAENDGTCKYCGDIDTKNPIAVWSDKTVCPKCVSWRDRSLVLVRHSSSAAAHIARVEARNADEREKKRADFEAEAIRSHVIAAPTHNNQTPDSRIDKLEFLIMRMAQEFGVKLGDTDNRL